MPDSTPTMVSVQRTSPKDVKIRDLLVSIDDQPDENLSFDRSIDFPVAAGDHTIRVSNRLFSKIDHFTIASGESISYSVANIPGGCFSILLILGGAGAYRVTLDRI